MADTHAPESPAAAGPPLASTADQLPYVPVSWLAVAAAASAGLLGLLLAVFGIVHFRAKRPLLEAELLILAIVAVVLSFAARRIIRNSEGTRTGILFGIDLPNAAWWGGLVLGLGYVSYLLAIEFSIRKDAQSEIEVWSDLVLKGDDDSLNRAFHRTQDPSQRKDYKPTEGAKLEARWGREFTSFRQCDLRRLIARNGTDCRIEIGGLRDWKYQPLGIDCSYGATLVCPEGVFPLQIPMKGIDGGTSGGGRQWQAVLSPNGFIDKERSRLTPYGWLVAHLFISGSQTTQMFLTAASGSRETRATVYTDFASNEKDALDFYRPLTVGGAQTRASVTGIAAAFSFSPGPAFLDYSAKRLFKLPGGAEPDEARLASFKQAWNSTGVVRAGERLRESTDVNDQISITDTAVTYRMPIEIPIAATRGEIIAARGGLVLECTAPEIAAELKRLRASADPAAGTEMPDAALMSRVFSWRVVRIESEMKPIKMEPPKMPDGGGPPGGGPPGGG